MHSSIASFSLKDVVYNRMPLPWVATSMQIWFAITISSPRVGSVSSKVVAVDVVDMLAVEDHIG